MTKQLPELKISRVRSSLYTLALVMLGIAALYYAKSVLLPIAFAGIVAMLVYPTVERLTPVVGRGGAIAVVMIGLVGLVLSTLAVLGYQFAGFYEEWPRIEQNLLDAIEEVQRATARAIGWTSDELETVVEEEFAGAQNGGGNAGRSVVTHTLEFLTDFLLFFVYLALILLEAPRLERFVIRRVPRRMNDTAEDALQQVRKVSGNYLWGRFLLICILFVLYSLGFYFGELQFPFVVAIICAILSLLPYLGGILAALLAVGVAALSDDFASVALWAVVTLSVAQAFESYVITPFLIGKEVSLNPLATMVAVIALSAIWGVGGAILAIPIVAMLRQVLEHLPGGEDYAYLLSDRKD